ncbi:uncharacterized protein LOC116201836 [Punica granatum]|uniref:Uncharacterized protein n=2 Tax=Punica granatum TaxID=22663 RepID=A0A218WKM7_PUNGR|nr:uncharacterized protein LOC116201836 [Punica granatum]OWM73387.1 hypothetical protein CDL15_Pgr026486 [Punica granatum]PKI71517.1 hypothetical protein CRG98_008034 [Punica granatum]
MVFNSGILIRVMDASADICQYTARIHGQDRLESGQLLDLICCLPLHHVGRLLLCLWTYLCVSAPDSYYYSSSSYSDSDEDAGDGGASSATADYVVLDYDSNSD